MEMRLIIGITVIIKDRKDNRFLEVLELEFSDLINLFILLIFLYLSLF
jgi:hypothetical protein